jgi:acid phosphatase
MGRHMTAPAARIVYTWQATNEKEQVNLKNWRALVAAQLLFGFGLALVCAQQTPSPAFNADSDGERIQNLSAVKKDLRDYHECTCKCGCYAHDLDAQADRAIAFLRERAARRSAGEKLALILDIDETALSNYAELSDADFEYIPDAWDAWVDAARAPAIPGTLRLFKEAQHLGVGVFFITSRPETQREVTERNLRAQGYDNWQKLVLRPGHRSSETVVEFKAQERAKIAADGYALALNLGDQWSDLKGQPEAEFSVKYPDPFYFIP